MSISGMPALLEQSETIWLLSKVFVPCRTLSLSAWEVGLVGWMDHRLVL